MITFGLLGDLSPGTQGPRSPQQIPSFLVSTARQAGATVCHQDTAELPEEVISSLGDRGHFRVQILPLQSSPNHLTRSDLSLHFPSQNYDRVMV